MYKKCQVVMLPTNQKATNGLQPVSNYSKPVTKGGLNLPISLGHLNRLLELGCQAYHLYILSDDKIKVSDYVYKKDVVSKVYKHVPTTNEWYKDERKVIASTDTTLNLPQPSPEFIKVFCEKQPTEVLVKYEPRSYKMGLIWLPQINHDNQISIKKIKQTYTREEVEAMFDIIRANDDIRIRGFNLNSLL